MCTHKDAYSRIIPSTPCQLKHVLFSPTHQHQWHYVSQFIEHVILFWGFLIPCMKIIWQLFHSHLYWLSPTGALWCKTWHNSRILPTSFVFISCTGLWPTTWLSPWTTSKTMTCKLISGQFLALAMLYISYAYWCDRKHILFRGQRKPNN